MDWKEISAIIDREIERTSIESARVRDLDDNLVDSLVDSLVDDFDDVDDFDGTPVRVENKSLVAIETGTPEQVKQAWIDRARAN